MSKKICVYAICKNEEQFVERWMDSVSEADSVYVLDTGSTDNTVSKLKERGAIVKSKIFNPWRFDVARNESLDMVPDDTDICVCLDLDEVIESGWRKRLESIWKDDTTRLRYNYNWSFDSYGKPAVNFYIEKIHSRNDYVWTHPVHEVLTFKGEQEVYITTDLITVNHYPDHTKSRGSYLPLLELSVKECPDDDRNMHYLGREYMFYGRWNDSIDTLILAVGGEEFPLGFASGFPALFSLLGFLALRHRKTEVLKDLRKVDGGRAAVLPVVARRVGQGFDHVGHLGVHLFDRLVVEPHPPEHIADGLDPDLAGAAKAEPLVDRLIVIHAGDEDDGKPLLAPRAHLHFHCLTVLSERSPGHLTEKTKSSGRVPDRYLAAKVRSRSNPAKNPSLSA